MLTSVFNQIRAWDIKTLEQKLLITDLETPIYDRPHGQLIATTDRDGKTIKIWDVRTGQILKAFVLPGGQNPIEKEFSPDGKTLIISTFSGIYVYDTASWETKAYLKKLSPDSSPVIGFTFSPDSQLLAMVGFSSMLVIQDMKTYEIKTRIVGHKKQIEQVRFSPDGKLFPSVLMVVYWRRPARRERKSN